MSYCPPPPPESIFSLRPSILGTGHSALCLRPSILGTGPLMSFSLALLTGHKQQPNARRAAGTRAPPRARETRTPSYHLCVHYFILHLSTASTAARAADELMLVAWEAVAMITGHR